jgi:hypothetical protein
VLYAQNGGGPPPRREIAFIRMDSEVQTLVRRAEEVWAVTRAECVSLPGTSK